MLHEHPLGRTWAASPRIVPFIFSWKGQFDQAQRIQAQLEGLFERVFVINSDDRHTRAGWIDVGDNYYFTGQFLKALELFDGDILFHVQADASYDNWRALFDNAVKYFRAYNWGVYAPNVDVTAWISERVDIDCRHIPEPHLRLVSGTDCTCWLIHREIIQQFMSRRSLFADNKYGWGIDLTMIALSYLNRQPVIRDYSHTVVHPPGYTYDKEAAMDEYQLFLKNLDRDLKPIVEQLLQDRQALARYFDDQ